MTADDFNVFTISPAARSLVFVALAGAWRDLTKAALEAGVAPAAILAIERGAPGTMEGVRMVIEDAAGPRFSGRDRAEARKALALFFAQHRADPEQVRPRDLDPAG